MTDLFDNEINERIKALAIYLITNFKSANAEVELNQQMPSKHSNIFLEVPQYSSRIP